MNLKQKRQVAAVMVAHFAAAFAALGVPPYFGTMLRDSLHESRSWLAGLLYVVPTLLTALSSPFWGKLADRIGAKPLLIRAQLGLALSFVLAGAATSTSAFALALILQGLVGGTFGASNAFLSTFLKGRALRDSLTLMQGSARAALVVAPVAVGLLFSATQPLRIYTQLAWLPLAAALIVLFLSPREAEEETAHPLSQPLPVEPRPAPLLRSGEVLSLQFLFTFATVVTFPYFLGHVQSFPEARVGAVGGFLFALPHLVYLLGAAPLSRRIAQPSLGLTGVGLLALAVSLAGQAASGSLIGVVAFRLLMGLSMTVLFISLHGFVASVARKGSSGATFGRFEASAKWGAVAAGCAAGVLSANYGLSAPLYLGAVAAVGAAGQVAYRLWKWTLPLPLEATAAVESEKGSTPC